MYDSLAEIVIELICPLFLIFFVVFILLYRVAKYKLNKQYLEHLSSIRAKEKYFSDLNKREKELQKQTNDFEESMRKANSDLEEKRADLNNEVRLRTIALAKNIAGREYLAATPAFHTLSDDDPTYLYSRLLPALSSDLKISSPFDIKANIVSSSGNVYQTTLYSCSCPDFMHRQYPCKHMLRLAVETGFLIGFDNDSLQSEIKDSLTQRNELTSDIQRKEIKKRDLQTLLSSKQQNYQWLAQQIADMQMMHDMDSVTYLRGKKRPATGTAAELEKLIKGELRDCRALAKQNEYQLNFYESLFPWLLDFKEVPPLEAFKYVDSASNASDEEISFFRNHLSPEEYAKLSPAERNQLALDRWKTRSRTDWEAGIDYERYICYLYERDGYKVESNGATHGLEDMGRDLIAKKHGETLVIQCKRWSQSKTIHEKHIFQLYGTTVLLSLESPKRTRGVFITTTALSDVARRCADYLGISVIENRPLEDYPLIKCNISKDGERIYHLPFDQQYDRVQIDFSSGEFYAATVKEAEDAGFRRSYRWHSNDE